MRTRLAHIWEIVSSTYWFVPGLMVAAAIALSVGALALDKGVSDEWFVRFVYAGGPDGARLLLSTVASSVITVAGVVFSLTIAAITQASSQFGPRLLRNFMRDRGNQVVLGVFVATFTYCLLVLRTIRSEDETGGVFIPEISVTVGVLLALASLGVLVFFIHHIAMSLQAPVLTASVARELMDAVETMMPPPGEGAAPTSDPIDPPPADQFDRDAIELRSDQSGYVQVINVEALWDYTVQHKLCVQLLRRPGEFVNSREVLARVRAPESIAPKDLESTVNDAYLLGRHRTQEQDLEYAIHQLVEIAVRALSPGINDPFTACTCLDWLGDAIGTMAGRAFPETSLRDRDGNVRLITRTWDFDGVCDAAFNPIRQYAAGSTMLLVRMLEVIGAVASNVTSATRRAVLARHAEMILRQAEASVHEPNDLRDVRQRYDALQKALHASDESR